MSYDLLMDMAKGYVPFEKVKVQGGRCEGRLKVPKEPERKNVAVDRKDKGFDYAKKYEEQDLVEDEIDELPGRGPMRRGKMMAAVEDLTSLGTFMEDPLAIPENALSVYEQYPFDHEVDPQLLVAEYKDVILSMLDDSSVIIIKGPTGCGKTTQVPQFILDDARSSQIYCNIAITQPRRIAAMSVAKRVCQERGWSLGSLVGYQIALEKKASADTRLIYCTAGVLLQQLIGQHSLSMYTHIIIDEVHERDSETDFLLIVIKKLLKMRGNRTKVILMSATINVDHFVRYFSKKVNNEMVKPPLIVMEDSVKKRFPVLEYYVDDLPDTWRISDINLDEPKISEAWYSLTGTLLRAFQGIDRQDHKNKPFVGSVLIFLPGIYEIEQMYSKLSMINQNLRSGKDYEDWLLCPLHSTMSFDEQMRVFAPPPTATRKIILATNIAESSITVPDIKYVIDFCLTKRQVQDKDTFYSSLQMTWVSKSQGQQRAGRVGRTMPGRVYRIVYRNMYEDFFEDNTPEMTRCPLEQLVLKAKKLDIGSPVAILGSAMDPPDLSNIQRTVLNLKEVGALTLMIDGNYDEEDGELTFIGTVMEALPLNIQLSKLILIGHMFSILRECIIMACCMAGKNIFNNPLTKKFEAFNARVAWSEGSASDAMTFLSAYIVWKTKVTQGKFARSGGETEQQYCSRNFLNLKALKEVERLEMEITNRLERLGIKDAKTSMVKENPDVLGLLYKVALAGAFYPNYFVHSPIDEVTAVKTVGGRDPFRTVYLSKFPQNQPGPLYRESIKQLFQRCGSDIKVQFDGSAKVYVEFGNSYGLGSENLGNEEEKVAPGQVMAAVYRAVKLRQLNIPMKIPMLQPFEAEKKARAIFGEEYSDTLSGSQRIKQKSFTMKTPLPDLRVNHVLVEITHIVDPHNFYAIIYDERRGNNEILRIHSMLNDLKPDSLVDLEPDEIVPDLLCVAPFSSGPHERPKYYRARVVQVDELRAKVFYIDYANYDVVEKSLIKGYGPRLIQRGVKDKPSACVCCRLAEVQPVGHKQTRTGWCREAIENFQKGFAGRVAYVKIYSIVNETMAVYLFNHMNPSIGEVFTISNDYSYNHLLVTELKFAQFMEEPYLSKENHMLREKAVQNPASQMTAMSVVDEHQQYLDGVEFQSPSETETRLSMTLFGPKSPLEMNIHSITRKCLGKLTSVDFNSVNSVLLDVNPMDPSSRLVVAGIVTQNFNGDRLSLRNTTIMPSIKGIVGLMCLMFCPRAELRVDRTRSFITGAMCGLGCDDEGMSYDQENDIEVGFDCKFDLTDIELVNKIRYWMNEILCGAETIPQLQMVSKPAAHEAQNKMIKYLLALFSKPRDPLLPTTYENAYEWNQIPEEYRLCPMKNDRGSFIFPLIWGVDLRETSSEEEIQSLRKKLMKLERIANCDEEMRNTVTCELCQVYFETPQAVALHLKTAVHKIRAKGIRVSEDAF